MKKIKLFLFIFISIFFSVNLVYAECTNEELEKYKELADNIRISYEYDDNSEATTYDEKNLFKITVSNIPQTIRAFESKLSYMFRNDTVEEYTIIEENNITGGSNLKFIFYTNDNTNCPNQKIKITNIKLPVYNVYHNDELCNGIEDYEYCHKIINNKITYSGFKKNVLKYKESLNQDEIEKIKDVNNNNNFKKIKNYIVNNPIIFIIVLVLLTTIIIIIIIIVKEGVKNNEKF